MMIGSILPVTRRLPTDGRRVSAGTLVSTLIAGLLLAFASWAVDRMAKESSPVARGAAYAGIRGCVNCHGQPEFPSRDIAGTGCSDVNTLPGHPAYEASCGDVMAYFEVIRLRRSIDQRATTRPEDPIVAGEVLARKYHCFQCHGELGQGGFANAGSFKGYVPGFFGEDFDVLTRDGDPAAVSGWIRNGMDPTIVQQAVIGDIARYFFDRQAVSMPRFNSLEDDEIEMLTRYVIALNGYGPITAETARGYASGEQLRARK